ncbi:unnamed protein product, partial [Polarella glacialis]
PGSSVPHKVALQPPLRLNGRASAANLQFSTGSAASSRTGPGPAWLEQTRRHRLRSRRTAEADPDAKALLVQKPPPDVGFWELSRFAAGCFGVYLASPLLSLVDSAFVGRCSGTAQLAALGPGTALCDSTAYVLSCVGVATTNLYASRRARGQLIAARRVASDALAIGMFSGAVLGALLFCFGQPLLSLYGAKPEVATYALSYVRWRALGAPLAILTTAAQATCLGDRDSTTPVIVVAISAVANVVCDALLVPTYGAAGAAIGTVLAQAFGAIFLLWVLRRRQLIMSA